MREDSASAGKPDPGVRSVVLLVGTMCAIHIVSQFLRSSVGVIAPDLARDVGLGAAGIGLLSSAFFLGFAGAQIPLGIAIDRWGPRLAMTASMGIAVLGVLLFAVATSVELLVFARVLIGLGCSSFFMGPLAIYSRWFAPERFSTLVGIQLGVSSVGVLAATAPLAYSATAIGWRSTFLVAAAVAAVIGALMFAIARDDPSERPIPRSNESLLESFFGLREVVRVPSFAPVFAMHFAGYSTFLTIFGLWAGPYLAHVYGYDLDRRGEVLLLLAIVHLIASASWGPADRLFGGYKIPAIFGAGGTIASLIWIAVVGRPSEAHLLVWFVMFGSFASCTAVITAHGRALFKPEFVGRGLTLLNLGTMGGVFVLQAGTGIVVGLFDAPGGLYPVDAYQAAFAVLAVVLICATLFYMTAHEPPRRPDAVANRA